MSKQPGATPPVLPRVKNAHTDRLRRQLEELRSDVNDRMDDLCTAVEGVQRARDTGERVLTERDHLILELMVFAVAKPGKPERDAKLGALQTWVTAAGIRVLRQLLDPREPDVFDVGSVPTIARDVLIADIERRHVELESRSAEQHRRQMDALREQHEAIRHMREGVSAAAGALSSNAETIAEAAAKRAAAQAQSTVSDALAEIQKQAYANAKAAYQRIPEDLLNLTKEANKNLEMARSIPEHSAPEDLMERLREANEHLRVVLGQVAARDGR